MHPPRIPLLLVALLYVVILPGGAVAGAQSSRGGAQVPSVQEADPQLGTQQKEGKEPDPLDTPRMKRLMNKSRHDAVKKDTDKLLELATELKMQVDKSSENTLSMDVVRKAQEIEKLAHSVKEKMKGM